MSALAACLWLATCSCESNGRERESAASPLHSTSYVSREGPPVVSGVAILAATGKPLAGVTLTLPDGTTAVSDEAGRFELAGMEPGLEGVLEARSKDGLVGENRLLPLSAGRLEVVVRLRRPSENH
jgi:hypothetical protein